MLTLLVLAACSRLGMGQDEMAWARAALDRNNSLQVVASDPQARTFTVRLKDSDKVRVIRLDQLVAGPEAASAGLSAMAGSGAGTPAETAAQAPASASGPVGPAPATGAAPGQQVAAGSGAPASAGEPPGTAGESATSGSGESPGTTPSQVQGPHAEAAADAKAGSVLASGPGYSIKASGSKGNAPRAAGLTAARGTPVERLHDPIICQGSRLLHIDNRNLEFDGNAVAAEDGCEIHITNSHIRAKGIGVLARAANVHIENSEIDGDSGAIEASDGAQIYAESSTFKGLNRHLQASSFHDLGGNVWN
ncbi:MAG: hypothetical protein ACREVV_15725 [Steroidobacteraceae bacterium]